MEVRGYLRWLLDRFCHQLCSPVGGIPKPVVKKITQGIPGPLSLDDELVGCAHSLQFGPRQSMRDSAGRGGVNAATTSFIQSRRSRKVLAMALMAERKTFVSRFGFVE